MMEKPKRQAGAPAEMPKPEWPDWTPGYFRAGQEFTITDEKGAKVTFRFKRLRSVTSKKPARAPSCSHSS